MSDGQTTDSIVGRGNRDGAQLFRDWFENMTHAPERGEKSAYVFVMGSIAEILRVFDFHTVFPEINSLQTAVRRVAHEYLNVAEDYGYSPDICGYVKADVAMQLQGGKHPMGRIPKPDIAVYTNACNTYIKWAEIWERMYHIPIFTLDVPGTRQHLGQTWPCHPDFEEDKKYVAAQLKELIATCEEVSGKKFDIDKLREIMTHANAMSRAWKRLLALNTNTPSVFNAVTDGTVYLGMANGFRGTAAGAKYFNEAVEEMEYKVAHKIGTLHDEKYRLIFVGVVYAMLDLQKMRGLTPATNQVFKLNAPRSKRCLIEAVVAGDSPLVGQSVRAARFRSVYNAAVLAVARRGERIVRKIGDIVLKGGDTGAVIEPGSRGASPAMTEGYGIRWRGFCCPAPLRAALTY